MKGHVFYRGISLSVATTVLANTLLLSGCSRSEHRTTMTTIIPSISLEGLRSVSEKKIFFGHQSVGYDLVLGVIDVLKQYPAINLKVMESNEPGIFTAPVLAHATVGRNADPESKIREFAERVHGGIGNRADIATFKFCYADFDKTSDAARVFGIYKRAMTDLARSYPRTHFVHVTVPLKATSEGWKKHIKNILGKPHPFIADNVLRNEFNQLMRNEYAGKQPFFDLAAVQATRADGNESFDMVDGKRIPSLVNEYTYDTGHLNERGRKIVARHFLGVLASL